MFLFYSSVAGGHDGETANQNAQYQYRDSEAATWN